MYVYIVTFVLSCICCKIVEKNENKKSVKIIFSIIAILIPSVIAGVRSSNVGTDVKTYVVGFFSYAQNASLSQFLNYTEMEIGYSILMYVIAKITNDMGWMLFVSEFITVGCIFLFAYNKRKQIPIWLVMASYFFLAYNRSLNIMRQFISLSIIIYSLIYFEKKQFKIVGLLFVLALSFHTTAFLSLPMYFIMYIYRNDYFKKSRTTILLLIFVITSIFSFGYEDIIYLLTYSLKIMPLKYYSYLKQYGQRLDINFIELVFKSIWVFIYEMIYSIKKEKIREERPYFIYLIVDLIIFPISFKISNADRIGYYYLYASLFVMIPTCKKLLRNDLLNQFFITNAILLILMVYWYRTYVVLGIDSTYPYTSNILTFLNF